MHRSSYFPVLVLALAGFPTHAHHSIAGMYYRDQQVTVTGATVSYTHLTLPTILLV